MFQTNTIDENESKNQNEDITAVGSPFIWLLIDTVLVKFKKRYPNQNVKVDIPENFIIIPMDPMLIEQVILNLLENAVYHAKGMTELISVSYTHLDVYKRQD